MMNMKLFAAAACLALGMSAPSLAQTPAPAVQQRAPEIDSFSVQSVAQLTPGSELIFTLQGTPSAQATFTISGITTNQPMREVEPGIYEGRYTIRSSDAISESTIVRANLGQGSQISSARLQNSLTSSTASSPTGTASSLAISQFTASPMQNLAPGTELTFKLVGTAGATASFDIAGVATNQPMRELSAGTYEGRYVIRQQDAFSPPPSVTARLDASGTVITSRLDQPLMASSTQTAAVQIPLEVLSPADNTQIGDAVKVTGRSAPQSTVNVKVKASNSLGGFIGINRDVFDRDIQTDAEGNFSFDFQPPVGISGTRYEMSLTTASNGQTQQETLVLIQQ